MLDKKDLSTLKVGTILTSICDRTQSSYFVYNIPIGVNYIFLGKETQYRTITNTQRILVAPYFNCSYNLACRGYYPYQLFKLAAMIKIKKTKYED